jgi:hypothetical protein
MIRCFVIGPIGDKFAPLGSPGRERYEQAIEVFEKVIAPACAEHSLELTRADQIAVSGEITEQVFRHLYEDEVVIADVSGGNPNVMYELGLRHTRDLLTVQIGEYGQLPFDLAAVRTIQFSRSERGLIDARKQLAHALTAGLAEGGDLVTATRVWLGRPPEPADEALQVDLITVPGGTRPTDVDEVDADGMVERMATAEMAFPRLTETVEEIGEILTELGVKVEEMGREFEVLNASHASASARVAAVKKFGKMLQGPADEFTRLTESFAHDMDEIDGSVNGILEFLRENPDSVERQDTQEFLDTLIDMVRSARQNMEDLSQFAGVVQNLGSVSKSLRGTGHQMAQSIRSMVQAVALMDEWEAAAVRLGRDRDHGADLTTDSKG